MKRERKSTERWKKDSNKGRKGKIIQKETEWEKKRTSKKNKEEKKAMNMCTVKHLCYCYRLAYVPNVVLCSLKHQYLWGLDVVAVICTQE
jgi:hypothetical protein